MIIHRMQGEEVRDRVECFPFSADENGDGVLGIDLHLKMGEIM